MPRRMCLEIQEHVGVQCMVGAGSACTVWVGGSRSPKAFQRWLLLWCERFMNKENVCASIVTKQCLA